MLSAPPNIGDTLIWGDYNPSSPPYYGHSTYIVESTDGVNYTLRLNSNVVTKRRVSLRHFIKKSSEKRVVTDIELAKNYSSANDMLIDELKSVQKRYFEATGLKL